MWLLTSYASSRAFFASVQFRLPFLLKWNQPTQADHLVLNILRGLHSLPQDISWYEQVVSRADVNQDAI